MLKTALDNFLLICFWISNFWYNIEDKKCLLKKYLMIENYTAYLWPSFERFFNYGMQFLY